MSHAAHSDAPLLHAAHSDAFLVEGDQEYQIWSSLIRFSSNHCNILMAILTFGVESLEALVATDPGMVFLHIQEIQYFSWRLCT